MKRSDDFSRPYKAPKVATTKSRKRDASARYSAIQGPLRPLRGAPPPNAKPDLGLAYQLPQSHLGRPGGGTAKAGGTTRRPLVLQMDRGRILFRTGGAPC
jgi:hypothetical protein